MANDGTKDALYQRAQSILKDDAARPWIKQVQQRMDAAGETSAEEAAAYIVTEYERRRLLAPKSVVQFIKDFTAKVRAWMFRNGVLLKADQLSIADIAAVARADARSLADKGLASDKGKTNSAKHSKNSAIETSFSVAPSALEHIKARWSGLVDKFIRGSLDETKTYEVLPSSTTLMKMVGLPDLPIHIGVHALDSLYNHGVKPSQMKQALDELANPRMVMVWNKSSRGELSLNFVTSMSNDKGEPFVIAIKPNKGSHQGRYHWLATITEKQPRSIIDMVREGGALYVGDGDISGVNTQEMRQALRFAKEKRGKESRGLIQAIGTSYSLPNLVSGTLYAKDLTAYKAQISAKDGNAPLFSRADPYADYLSLSYNPQRRPKHRLRQCATALRVCTRRGRSVRCG